MSNAIPGSQGQGQDEAKPAETDEEILQEARDRYQACDTNESDNRTAAKDDLLFLSGGVNQWDPIDAQIRTAQKRPMITVNNLPTFLHQVTNEHRQNKLGGKVRPVDDKADEETAEVIQGVVRHIEYDSNASVATVTAVNSAAAVGFGYYRLVTEHESPTSFDQKICFKRIRNALSVHIDPLSQEPDGSDMKFCFIDSLEDRKEFKRQYPNAKANNTNLLGQEIYKGWFTENTVLVCEYYRIKEVEATLCQLTDGQSFIGAWKGEPYPPGFTATGKERKSTRSTVEWFKITGADVLDKTVIKCNWIPVFPVYGDEIDIDGKVVRQGIIRNSKDSFKMYNVCITTAIEEVASRAKSPYIMAEGQDEGHEAQWANINRIPYASVKYKPTTVDGVLTPPPQRSPMADIPAGWLSMTMHFADNKKATTGLFDSSLGAKGTATSGIQEREQQAQGDIANYHYADNLKISYRHALRCIVSMIPHYYDGARIVRMLGEDEESEVVPINQPYQRKNPKSGAIETVMHDLTVGEFDVTVSAGPSYSTARQEAAEFMTNAMQAAKDPAAANVLTYLAIKNQDVPGAEEAVEMLKKLLPPGVAEPEDGEEEPIINTPHGPMPASKVGPFIQQMGEALQNAHQEVEQLNAGEQQLKAGEQANQQAELQLKGRELEIKQAEVDIKKFEAETARAEAEAEAVKVQAEADAIRLKAEVEANCTHEESKAKAESIRMKTDADVAKSQAETVVPQSAPKGMTIKAPSGQVYEVGLT